MSLRRLTRLLINHNASGTWGDLTADIYNALLGVVILIAMLWIPLQRASEAPGSAAPLRLDPEWLVVIGCAWALSLLVALMSRIGPVALTSAQSRWWLPSLEDRAGLLAPVLWMRWGVAAAAGGAIGLLLSVGLAMPVVTTIVSASLLSTAAVSLLVLRQPSRRDSLWPDVLVAVVPVVGVVLVTAPIPAPTLSSDLLVAVAVLLALTLGVSALGALRALPRIHDGDLARAARTAGQLGSAVLELNAREFSRALERPARRTSRHSLSFVRVRGPMRAIAAADTTRLARSPRHLAQIAVAVAAVVITASLSVYSPVVTVLVLIVAGYGAALATAEGARRAQLSPALDSLLPLSAARTRAARLILPSAAMAIAATAMTAIIGLRAGEVTGFAMLGLIGAPVWAAAALRGAYREQRQLSGVVVPTPMGAFPADAAQVFGTGIDLAVFALIPTWIAVLLSTATWQLTLAQAACSALATWLVVHAAGRR